MVIVVWDVEQICMYITKYNKYIFHSNIDSVERNSSSERITIPRETQRVDPRNKHES